MKIKVADLLLSIWTILVLSAAVLGEKWTWPDSDDSTGNSRSLYDEQESDSRGDTSQDTVNCPPGGCYARAVDRTAVYPVRVYQQGKPLLSVDTLKFRDFDDSDRLNRDGNQQFERCTCGSPYTCVAPGVLLNECNKGNSLCCFGPKSGRSYDGGSYKNGIYSEQNREASFYPNQQSAFGGASNNILVGPGGPTGIIGPSGNGHNQYAENHYERPNAALIHPSLNNVLVGPGGPTGIIGPENQVQSSNGVLVGPGGPTGIIGPGNTQHSNGVLVGPGGPTGIIGPGNRQPKGVLVGPGGPTGIIGPGNRQHSNGVLVGPGGPTGIIGPGYNSFRRPGYNRRPHAYNGVLVGPGGPTGIIGPGGYRGGNRYPNNGILVGPDGPTGIIGPRS